MRLRHERIRADGLDLHVACAGSGPPVLLLHGFPEHWRCWQHQIEPLARAGFSVFAPDLRGYNLSDRPLTRDAYHLRHLVADVAALVRATGHPRAHIVGHDWGGVIAWAFAGAHPELLDKLVILNAPHMEIYLRKVWRPPQLFRSWYVLFFQIPGLPEWLLSAGGCRAIREMFRQTTYRDRALSAADIDACIDALSQPGALTAALNYYRANIRSRSGLRLARSARVAAETLVIWGEQDRALDVGLLDGLARIAPRARVYRIPDAGHWVQNEAPEEVNLALVGFLTGESPVGISVA